ncbi:transposase [Clostridioides difficile]
MRRHLWNPSYFSCYCIENTEEQIRKYINNQKKQVK